MAKKRLEGKVAIVTGAGSGIGRAVALLFAEHGAKVVVNDYGGPPNEVGEQSSEPAERVVAEIQAMGGQAVANAGNVAEMATGEQMVQQAIDAFGQVDIAVCCAGILRERMVFNMTEAEWDDVVAVHLKGHFALTKYVSQVFRQQRSGRLIFISSNAMFGAPGQPNYAAAKGGVWSFMRSCANALGRYNVTCNAILPAASTRLMDRTPQAMKQRPRARNRGVGGERGGRAGTPSTSRAGFCTSHPTRHRRGDGAGLRRARIRCDPVQPPA